MEKLRQLEQRTPDTNLKNMLRALILLAQRTKQILAKRRSPRSRQQILGLKDILTKAGFSSRNTLYEWVKRFDPNNPSSIDDRKSRIPGATRAMIQSLQSDYARGKVKNYAQGLAWLKSHIGSFEVRKITQEPQAWAERRIVANRIHFAKVLKG